MPALQQYPNYRPSRSLRRKRGRGLSPAEAGFIAELRQETGSPAVAGMITSLLRRPPPGLSDETLTAGSLLSLLTQRRPKVRVVPSVWADRGNYAATSYPAGSLLVITDHPLVFVAVAGSWVYRAGYFYDTAANTPAADLGANDVWLVFRTSDTHQTFRWTGSAFVEDLAPGLLKFLGSTNAFPGLKRSGAKLQVVTADDGGLSDLEVLDEAYDASGWNGSGEVPTKNAVRDKIEGLNLASGTYTPTFTGVANVTSLTGYDAQYVRVGSVVTVSGKFDVTPTAAAPTTTEVGISLPVASDLGALEQLGGSVHARPGPPDDGSVYADTVNDRAQAGWKSTVTTPHGMMFHFTYRII